MKLPSSSLDFLLVCIIIITGESEARAVKRRTQTHDQCQYVDTRRYGFQGYFDVTMKSLYNDGSDVLQDVTDTLAVALSLHDDIVITAAQPDGIFQMEEVCVETRGMAGIFWEYEQPAPPPRIITVGSSVFISGVGGALYHSVSPIIDQDEWTASCVTFDGRLSKVTLSPMVVQDSSAAMRNLRISGCLL